MKPVIALGLIVLALWLAICVMLLWPWFIDFAEGLSH